MATVIDEDCWDDILAFIEEDSLVPVLGPELLQVQLNGADTHLYRYVADCLAQRYKLPASTTPYAELEETVRAYLAGDQRDVSALYRPIWDILTKASDIAIPPALLQLAQIRQLDWFVTTTFDNYMVRALDQVRFRGQPTTAHLHFSPNRSREEAEQIARRPAPNQPMVYSMFGKVSASPNYAIHDEDLLEFVHALVSLSALSPESWLADEMRKKNLLLIGVHFSDWISRFVMRMASSNRLSIGSDRKVFVIGDSIGQHSHLAEFLRLFARRTRVFETSAVGFAAELLQRWQARQPAPPPGDTVDSVVSQVLPANGEDAHRGDIFISYVREDLQAARALCDAISGMGGDVWFDERRLQPGDAWRDEILGGIRRRVRLFVPVISQQTERRREGFVFEEWQEAAERSKRFAPGQRRGFLVPVVIDENFDGSLSKYQQIQEVFRDVHVAHAPGGRADDALLQVFKEQIRDMRR